MDLTIYQKNQVIFGTFLFIIFYSVYAIYFNKNKHSLLWDILITSFTFFLILYLGNGVANLSLDF